ncbi:MAG TPA: T9SS type A sorting domain-containing protein [Hymenobacter sp.]|uniref:T9SS type A sorting domain-containing protein n=1 Tax=Hymenobacter sp. TaxID=1898978 RepID=UPI002D80C8B2|nr:T9SS type A sorting domain-containing protein [Hymenobacter sp.]HET9503536.1 T9SS type A sorting domain-containing protein [Hymenobacter sp.]
MLDFSFLPGWRWLALALPLAGLLASPARAQLTPTFAPFVSYTTGGGYPSGLVAVDVNNDGKLDLLTANYNPSVASVLLGNGNGTFRPVLAYSSGGSGASKLAVADVNGDSKPDILITNEVNGTVGVLLGNGDGTFQAATTYSVGGAYDIVVADVNGDGKLDLLTTSGGVGPGTAGVLLGNGNGTFLPVATFSTGGSYPLGLAVADVNGDGKPDLLTANNSTNNAGVLLGNGNGTFQAPLTYNISGHPYGLRAADVNGDGKIDLIATISDPSAAGTVGVVLGNGNGTFRPATTYRTGGYGPAGLAVADVNGDGQPDLLATNQLSTAQGVGVLPNTGSGAFPNAYTFPLTLYTTPRYPRDIIAADVNSDGKPDLLVTTNNSVEVNVLLNTTAYAPDLVVNTTTDVAASTYNSITVNSPGVATLAGDVTVNTAVTVNSGATLYDNCRTIRGAGSFTLAAGATLGICSPYGIAASGTGQTTGPRSFSPDASYVYNGSGPQSTGTGLPGRVRNLTTTNRADLTLTAPTSVAQVLTIGAAGNLRPNGNALTLLSDAGGTALVVNSGTGVVIGGVAVQRYLDPSLNPGLGYRHFAPPVTNSYVGDLATPGFAPVLNPAYNTAAKPALVQPFPTVFGYDETRLASTTNDLKTFDKGFFSPAAPADPLVPGRGYAVNIAGTELVDFNGSLHNGDLTVPLTRSSGTPVAQTGWALLGNPYAAPLDLRLVTDADRNYLNKAFYVYQSTGQYAGQYRSYVNGLGSSPLIASGQGFFVQLAAGQASGSLTFRNAQRVTSYASQATLQRPAADPRPQVQLELTGAGLSDAFVTYVEAGATPAFDAAFDAIKLPNSTGLNLSSVATSGESLAIDARPAFAAATVLPLTVGVPAAGTYALAAASLANLPAGLDAWLADDLTGQMLKLSAGTSYAFSVSVAEAQALISGRFRLLFRPATALATAPAFAAEGVSIYPNPAHERFTVVLPGLGQASTVRAELLNSLGQVVRRQTAALPATGTQLSVDAAGLAAGVYTLRLQAGSATLAKRLVVQ